MPTLKVPRANGMSVEVTTKEEKVATFHQLFFPSKPATSNLPDDPTYPARVKYRFKLSEVQLRCQISRLQPSKALGADSIPNVVLKQMAELI